jgi:NAD(P)-dependent dehydrogenase (short-subunit alcohol dehydrogenase family)
MRFQGAEDAEFFVFCFRSMSQGTILITGTSRGMGASLVDVCLNQGWDVIACQRTVSGKGKVSQLRNSSSCIEVEMDVSRQESVTKSFHNIAESVSCIDVLVNNAGVFPEPTDTPFESLKPSWFQEVFAVNLIGTSMVTQACLPFLKKSTNGRIVNISSGAASITQREGRRYCYGASKAALNHVTRGLANELSDQKLTVVALSPGWVRTDMGGNEAELEAREVAHQMEQTIRQLSLQQSGQFLDRFGKPDTYAW